MPAANTTTLGRIASGIYMATLGRFWPGNYTHPVGSGVFKSSGRTTADVFDSGGRTTTNLFDSEGRTADGIFDSEVT